MTDDGCSAVSADDQRIDRGPSRVHIPQTCVLHIGTVTWSPPWCLEVSEDDLATDAQLFVLLRGLRGAFVPASPAPGSAGRLDALLLNAPDLATRVAKAAAATVAAYTAGDAGPLVALLLDCPTVLTAPGMAAVCADMLNNRDRALKRIGDEAGRRRKASPREKARRLRGAVDSRKQLALAKGENPPLKQLLIEVVGERVVSDERRVREEYEAGGAAPYAQFVMGMCREHAGMVGVFPANPMSPPRE